MLIKTDRLLQPPPKSRFRKAFVIVVSSVGCCEALTVSPWFDVLPQPEWLAMAVAMVGFIMFIVLVGFIGNSIVAVGLLLMAWRTWRWPFWRAMFLSLPFWFVTYRLMPKPW